jgi:hypothetical protein
MRRQEGDGLNLVEPLKVKHVVVFYLLLPTLKSIMARTYGSAQLARDQCLGSG